VSQLITKTFDDIDDAYKQGVKTVAIDKKLLSQEIERLASIIKDRKDILLGTRNIFPEVMILDEFELVKGSDEQSENEEDFNTSRTETPKKALVSRKFFLKFDHHLQNGNTSVCVDEQKNDSITDNL
jgi:hypothetical protein